jgi:hypothetical protein
MRAQAASYLPGGRHAPIDLDVTPSRGAACPHGVHDVFDVDADKLAKATRKKVVVIVD